MSYKFGASSLEKLKTCDSKIIFVMEKAIQIIDFSVICGHRGMKDQNKAFRAGRSKLQWPKSKHNSTPSKAIDIAPWPINWKDTKRFYYLGGIVMGIAQENNIQLRWGGDWDMDGDTSDNSFNDLAHFELV